MKRFANVSIPSIKKIIHTSFEKQLLKSCSVRLFILIHFYANANTGITSPLDLEDLAQALDCNIKTVRSNILRLESCGFFDVSMDPVTEEYTFTIHDYTKMYNPIGLGGGYIQCTYDLLEQLLQIKSINELRVILMLLCEAITTELQSSAKLAVAKLTFKELLAGLPKYVKPGVVKQILDHANSFKTIFKEEYTRKKRYIAAKLNDCFNGATTKNQVRQEAYSEIVSFTTEMDDVIRTFNTYLFEDKLRERMQYEEILKTEYGIASIRHLPWMLSIYFLSMILKKLSIMILPSWHRTMKLVRFLMHCTFSITVISSQNSMMQRKGLARSFDPS
ncbi:hypothetical protein DXB45_09120 [Clostridium sp. OM04-12AA]|nr:hypothetical protein [Clostridium sp. OM04-12AA]RHV51969.1 hypothetical protein DXB45_09120 [Clostridium sp. OM04-12AA]